MHALQHPYPSVLHANTRSYGGRQQWSARWDLQRCGCGAVAMTDLVLYLARYHGCDGPAEAALDPVPLAEYDRLCSRLQLKYLPMIPPAGILGPTLASGISLYCRIHKIPLTAFWGVRTKNFWTAMADMLDRDLPVVFSIGPPWGRISPLSGRGTNSTSIRRPLMGSTPPSVGSMPII